MQEKPFEPVGDTVARIKWFDDVERSVSLYEGSDNDIGLLFLKGDEVTKISLTNQAAMATFNLLSHRLKERGKHGN